MSKKHPGSPEMNKYQVPAPLPPHFPKENEPPHHDYHELEHFVEERYLREKAGKNKAKQPNAKHASAKPKQEKPTL